MVIIEANYSKKVGLPAYSSHQYSVTIRTELSDLAQLEKTNTELYARLQSAVDSQIVNAGHLPTETPANNNNRAANSTPASSAPANRAPAGKADNWNCSPKQQELVEKIIRENNLDPAAIEKLAGDRFNAGLRQLNKVQASALIDELLEAHGGKQTGNRGGQRSSYARGGRQ